MPIELLEILGNQETCGCLFDKAIYTYAVNWSCIDDGPRWACLQILVSTLGYLLMYK